MRDIKFRAWRNSGKGFWLNPNYMTISADGQYVEETGDKFNTYEEVTLREYTGMKDKNDTDIYDGDIVCCPCADFSRPFPFGLLTYHLDLADELAKGNATIDAVEMKDGCWGVVSNHPKDKGSFIPLSQFCDACEVIGNIHEHPELLKTTALNPYTV